MKPVSPELLTLFSQRQFYHADIYTFWGGNLGNTILRYCAGDTDLVVNGHRFSAGGQTGPYFDRSDNKAKVHQKMGVEVDTMTVDVIPGSSTIFNVSFQTAVRYGLFDGSVCLIEKVFMPTYGDTRMGTVRSFLGRVTNADTGRSFVTFSLSSHLELLNTQMPRNYYQATCKNNLGDAACKVNLDAYMTTGVVIVGSTQALVLTTIGGSPIEGAFDQGKIKFTSGFFSGLSYSIKKVTYGSPAQIQLLNYLPTVPETGATFNIYYGCDKTWDSTNGCSKFNNTALYRAEPSVPLPTTAY